MTQIDFYILPDSSLEAQLHFACRLTEKAQRLGRKVYIATGDRQHSEQLDELLWTFRPESFIPHACQESGDDSETTEGKANNMDVSVLIGHNNNGGNHHDLLINLSRKVPDCFSRFERLSEIVIQEHSVLSKTRENYKFYRDRGYPIRSHDLRTRNSR